MTLRYKNESLIHVLEVLWGSNISLICLGSSSHLLDRRNPPVHCVKEKPCFILVGKGQSHNGMVALEGMENIQRGLVLELIINFLLPKNFHPLYIVDLFYRIEHNSISDITFKFCSKVDLTMQAYTL